MTDLIELPHALNRSTKVLLVMDVVESVRLIVQDEKDFVRRWQQLVQQAEQRILPLHGGRIVKSLGDGLMLEFADAAGCVRAAFAFCSTSASRSIQALVELVLAVTKPEPRRSALHLLRVMRTRYKLKATSRAISSSTAFWYGGAGFQTAVCAACPSWKQMRTCRRMP
jgi:class 3 adenylate cyclase